MRYRQLRSSQKLFIRIWTINLNKKIIPWFNFVRFKKAFLKIKIFKIKNLSALQATDVTQRSWCQTTRREQENKITERFWLGTFEKIKIFIKKVIFSIFFIIFWRFFNFLKGSLLKNCENALLSYFPDWDESFDTKITA